MTLIITDDFKTKDRECEFCDSFADFEIRNPYFIKKQKRIYLCCNHMTEIYKFVDAKVFKTADKKVDEK
jgi:hypothetical protein